jgi:Restriction endonuclease S subunits
MSVVRQAHQPWKECKLGEHVFINSRSIDKNYPYKEIEYLDTGSITDGKIASWQHLSLGDAPSRAKRIVKNNDIVLSMVRPIQRHYGFLSSTKPNSVVSTGFVVISAKDSIEPYFLYSFLTQEDITEYLDVVAEGSTSAYPAFTPDVIEKLPILLPPIPEQRAIAGVLSSLDDKIDLLHRQNKTLECMAEALWRKMFVEEAEPNWKKGKLGNEMDITMGQSPPGHTYNEEKQGIVFFQGRAEFDFRFPRTRLYCTEPKRLAKKGDTLVSVRAPVGDINIAYEDCCIGRGLAAVRHKRDYESYTFYKIRSLKDDFDSFEQQGTVFGSIGKDDFNGIDTFIPDLEKVQQFEAIAKPFDDKIFINSYQIRTLSRLRDTLLPELMGEEVRVKG